MPEKFWPLAYSTWDDEEEKAIIKVLRSKQLTAGPRVREYEEAFAGYIGSRYAVMTNSGSSANLIAVAALQQRFSRKQSVRPLHKEAVVPAVAWSTTYAPLIQHGYKLRLIDVNSNTLNADIGSYYAAINENTSLIVGVNILGTPAPMDKIREFAIQHGVPLLEDNCESFGARIRGKACGTFGDIGTFSTFFTHHLNTIEGGVAVTDDPVLYELLLCLRAHGWTKDLPAQSLLAPGWKEQDQSRYCFLLPGYNVRPDELRAAVGLVQLRKAAGLEAMRGRNSATIKEMFGRKNETWGDYYSVPYAFTFVLGSIEQRKKLAQRLTEAGIEHRMITGGCFTEHPLATHTEIIQEDLINAWKVHHCGLFVANHPYDLTPQIMKLREIVEEATKN